MDLDVDTFKRERVQPLVDRGWDKYIARAYCLVAESQKRSPDDKITKERLKKVGKELKSLVIYVGDGASDAPCFTVVNQNSGIGIGLYKEKNARKWSEQDKNK